MARDYKRRAPARKKSPVPGWLWLLAGLTLGLFIAFLVYLGKMPGTPGAGKAVTEAPSRDTRSVKKEAPPKAPEKPARPLPKAGEERKGLAYDFYTILPELEVPVPDNEPAARGLPPTPVDPGTYVLQVGAFKNARDADALKAQLALLGIVSSIQSVTVNGTDTWHRVRVGPVSDMKKLDQLRSQLRQNDIRFMLLREKSG